MRPAPCTEARRRQRGDALLEAMVGLLIAALVGLGMAYNSARALNGKRFAATQTLGVSQLRNLLTHADSLSTLCGGGSTLAIAAGDASSTSFSVPTSISCTWATVTVSGAGLSATTSTQMLSGLTLSTTAGNATAITLFGGDGVITLSQ